MIADLLVAAGVLLTGFAFLLGVKCLRASQLAHELVDLGDCADDQAAFEADMDYLRGLSNAIFEHGSRDDLIAIARRDALR